MPPSIKRYSFAVLAVVSVTFLKLLLEPLIGLEDPCLLFSGAVMVSACYGGLRTGLLATALAAVLANYFFLAQLYLDRISSLGQVLQLFAFVLEGLLISGAVAALQAAKRKAQSQQEALRQSEEGFRWLVDGVKDYAIFRLDADGCIVSWNAGAERIEGYEAAEIIGRHFSCFYTPEEREGGVPDRLLKTAAAESRAEIEGWRVRKDGARFWAHIAIAALRDDAGNLKGFAKVIRDGTAAKQTKEELAQAIRIKDEFLVLVSHELRTPLSTIIISTQILQNKKINDPAIGRGLDRIEQSGKILSSLIEDLLDVSQIVQGQIRLNARLLDDIAPFVKAAVEIVKPAAEAKVIKLDSALEAGAGKAIGDPQRLQQIFWNLLSNAVKFTPEGGEVIIFMRRVKSHIEISVSDTGKGISLEFLPFIFDRFSQETPSNYREGGGLGLGLAISRHLVELHGGTIAAASEGEGKGATFTVMLPIAANEPSDSIQAPNT